MRRFLVYLVIGIIFVPFNVFAGLGDMAVQPLDQSMPCPGGGSVDITGTYAPITSNLSSTLIFNDCSYADEGDEIIVNGSLKAEGTLPFYAGNLNLTVSFDELDIEEKSSEDGMDENFSSKCSGQWVFTGTVTNGVADMTHTSDLTCSNSGSSKVSMDEFIGNLLRADFQY